MYALTFIHLFDISSSNQNIMFAQDIALNCYVNINSTHIKSTILNHFKYCST